MPAFTLLVLAAALPACALFSPGPARDLVAGTYAGTLATSDFTLPFEMTVSEGPDGRMVGTATLRRGDIEITYTVSGLRTGDALRLALASEGDDLAVEVTSAGQRLTGTATGGDLVEAALTLTRTGALPG